ncbi:DUF397 domain-containing protein [Streptomyces corynorhini]|uniref:DUF397 domain-containing protein n=1 Tax=Streptomyces corynorhini TaxID=2282652 RepID=A0A370B4P6_9ACTN|nr:DUF397 domain-containing protein [Streptomyces corynorhini]RDG35064.1 DUF397 domain-containing protein [Streptomyces corynorhini]
MNELANQSVDLTDAAWRTSSYTAGDGRCVEVAPIPTTGIAFRDTKDRALPAARASGAAWATFVAAVTADALPRP